MSVNAEEERSSRIAAIFPGSFDPLTNGHLDLIGRASKLADSLIVAVLGNTQKQPLFDIAERMDMIRESTAAFGNVEVDSFQGMLVDYAGLRRANLVVRGIRAISDYESELQMALINRRLRPTLETVFLMAAEAHSFISSRMVKEIVILGGDVSQFVPVHVADRLRAKLQARKEY